MTHINTKYNMYIHNIVIHNILNNTYHKTIKLKAADLKSSTYIDSSIEINDEDAEFKIGNIVRTSKYKKHFCKRLCSKLI